MHKTFRAGCIWDESLKKWMSLEDLLKHPDPDVRSIWENSNEKVYGNLFQGFGDTKGINVCTFIQRHQVPHGQKVAYPQMVVAYRPEKVKNPNIPFKSRKP